MKRTLYLLLSTITALGSLTPAALAASVGASSPSATNQSFQISPPTSNYAANPGQTITGTIKVTNLTDQALGLNVGKQNFVAKGEEGEIELTNDADPLYSLAPWFSAAVTQIQVPGRQTKAFTYTIAVPANAEPGGRYGSITFNTIAPKLASGQSGAAVQQQIAAVVFLRINGKANEKLTVASFATDKSFYEYGPVHLLTRIKNVGSVHEKATGTITVKNMLGFTVASFPLDEHFVIPGAIRRLHNDWPAGNKHNLLFGRYSVHMDATYGGGQKITADTSFTALPYRLLAIILIIAIIVFVLFWRGRKRFGRAFRILAGKE